MTTAGLMQLNVSTASGLMQLGGGASGTTLVVAASDALNSTGADYICDGTADDVQINAAIAALPAGGGTVMLTEGTFDITATITLTQRVNLCGRGDSTILSVSAASTTCILIASGTTGIPHDGIVEKLRITMRATSSGDGIVTTKQQAKHTIIRDISFTGGSSAAWAMTLDGLIGALISNIWTTSFNANGIQFTNSTNVAVNFGNALLQECIINLSTNTTTAYSFVGGAAGGINLITVLRCEAHGTGAGNGCVGFNLGANLSDITLTGCDAENCQTGYALGGGTSSARFVVLNCTNFGCTTDYTQSVSTAADALSIIGGNNSLRTAALDYRASRDYVRAKALGVITETYPRQTSGNAIIGIDGTVYVMAVGLLAGDTVTNISVGLQTAGATMTLSKVGLYNSALDTLLASSVDQGTAWQSTGVKTIAMQTPYVVPTTGLYYVAIVSKGATIPKFLSAPGSGNFTMSNTFGSGVYPCGGMAAQTDLPASITVTGSILISYWAGIS